MLNNLAGSNPDTWNTFCLKFYDWIYNTTIFWVVSKAILFYYKGTPQSHSRVAKKPPKSSYIIILAVRLYNLLILTVSFTLTNINQSISHWDSTGRLVCQFTRGHPCTLCEQIFLSWEWTVVSKGGGSVRLLAEPAFGKYAPYIILVQVFNSWMGQWVVKRLFKTNYLFKFISQAKPKTVQLL